MQENYLVVQDGVVTNVCIWDGSAESWTPPRNSVMLVQANTPTKIWGVVNGEWNLVESLGDATIGFFWDGEFCVTNEPQPEVSAKNMQPISVGTQTL